jgi:hypothetical protein
MTGPVDHRDLMARALKEAARAGGSPASWSRTELPDPAAMALALEVLEARVAILESERERWGRVDVTEAQFDALEDSLGPLHPRVAALREQLRGSHE